MQPSHGITKAVAAKVLEVIDAGLSHGLGEPIPGKMCVEAAVSFAMGEEFSDGPTCVEEFVRQLKISLNDYRGWKSSASRAAGLRRVAIAQLGSIGVVKYEAFRESLKQELFKTLILPVAAKPSVPGKVYNLLSDFMQLCLHDEFSYSFEDCVDEVMDMLIGFYGANQLDVEGTLCEIAECAVQALKTCKSPGCKYLYLTEK